MTAAASFSEQAGLWRFAEPPRFPSMSHRDAALPRETIGGVRYVVMPSVEYGLRAEVQVDLGRDVFLRSPGLAARLVGELELRRAERRFERTRRREGREGRVHAIAAGLAQPGMHYAARGVVIAAGAIRLVDGGYAPAAYMVCSAVRRPYGEISKLTQFVEKTGIDMPRLVERSRNEKEFVRALNREIERVVRDQSALADTIAELLAEGVP